MISWITPLHGAELTVKVKETDEVQIAIVSLSSNVTV
jgi:hypothetical protein